MPFETFVVAGASPVNSIGRGTLERISEDISSQHEKIAELGGKLVGQAVLNQEGGYLFFTAEFSGAERQKAHEAAQASLESAAQTAREQIND